MKTPGVQPREKGTSPIVCLPRRKVRGFKIQEASRSSSFVRLLRGYFAYAVFLLHSDAWTFDYFLS
jgi:hypothetical protein